MFRRQFHRIQYLACVHAGSPYQTVVYTGLTPVVSTINAILSINGKTAAAGATITGTRFALVLNNGQVCARGPTFALEPFQRYSGRVQPLVVDSVELFGQGKPMLFRRPDSQVAGCSGMSMRFFVQHLPHFPRTLLSQTWIVHTGRPVTVTLAPES